jgi:2-C-methyl-D-erythritol 4-phosphate cytidylyltransferase
MIAAIITAAGKGTRIKSNISKQFIHIFDKPILAHTIRSFQKSKRIDEIYVTVSEDHIDFCEKEIIGKNDFSKVKELVLGGETRQDSVFNALKRVPKKCRIVAVHDGVRPLITPEEIDYLINSLIRHNKKDDRVKGIIIASPAYETVKKITEDKTIDCTVQRSSVCMAQTPQTFFYNDLLKAHIKADADGYTGTDDASLLERIGWKVKVVIGKHENIKVTTPMDLFLAELIMGRDGKHG